jgi:hypothetical protein
MNCKTVYFSNDENPPITSNKQYNFEKPLAINNERQANPNKTLNSRFRKKINWKQNIEINHENHAEIFVKKKFMPNEKNYQTRHDQVLKRTLTFCSSLFFVVVEVVCSVFRAWDLKFRYEWERTRAWLSLSLSPHSLPHNKAIFYLRLLLTVPRRHPHPLDIFFWTKNCMINF